MALPTKKERIRRKKVMLAAGINVPNTDDSWGPWWEKLWKKAITHTKTNTYYGKPTVWNFLRMSFDNMTGNTTYEAEPLPIGGTLKASDDSAGALIKRTLNNWQHDGDPVRDITMLLMPDPFKFIKVGKTVVKGIPKLVKSVPKLFTKEGAKRVAKTAIKEVPKAGAGYLGGKTVDKVSEVITGKSWAENITDKMSRMAGFHIYPIFGEIINPGYGYGYRYGNFIGNNFFSNLGRYTLDNLRPWGYSFNKEQLVGLGKTFILPFYKTPPTFFTHRPKWYTSRKGTQGSYNEFLEARFENGANWARIPESEVPRIHFTWNSNGTVSPTHINKRAITGKDDFYRPEQTIVEIDDITPGMVGGEHSDYTYLGDDLAGNSLFQYSDRLRLNPLWIISDLVKNKFNLQEGSWVYNLVDRLGGIDLSPALGYKPFTIEFLYGKLFSPGPIQTTDAILIKDVNKAFTNPKP